MDLNLKDKAVFITGSTAGVGLQSHDPLQEKALASISKGARKAGDRAYRGSECGTTCLSRVKVAE